MFPWGVCKGNTLRVGPSLHPSLNTLTQRLKPGTVTPCMAPQCLSTYKCSPQHSGWCDLAPSDSLVISAPSDLHHCISASRIKVACVQIHTSQLDDLGKVHFTC